MNKVVLLLCFLASVCALANHGDVVESQRLRKLVQRCENDPYEADCLKRGIYRLIDREREPQTSLVCKSNGNLFAAFDESANAFLDGYYAKTGSECRQTIERVNRGLICSTSSDSKYAVREIATRNFLSPNYSITLNECLISLEEIRGDYICIAGSGGKFARYNMKTKNYLDSQYSMTLQECLDVL